MSLLSLLNSPDVKQGFSEEFTPPPFPLQGDLLAPPRTKHYTLIGTAFDYLMRFRLKRLNPKAETQTWIAEYAPQRAVELGERAGASQKDIKSMVAMLSTILSDAQEIYSAYLIDGKLDDTVILACLDLAGLDPVYRAGVLDPPDIDDDDILDMRQLARLIPTKSFKARHCCLLNPTFGKASTLVGGADADLIIDSRLIDIKTTKDLKLTRRDFNQIIGYKILSVIENKKPIDNIGIYFSRYGLTYELPTGEIPISADFVKWFTKRAKEEFGD